MSLESSLAESLLQEGGLLLVIFLLYRIILRLLDKKKEMEKILEE